MNKINVLSRENEFELDKEKLSARLSNNGLNKFEICSFNYDMFSFNPFQKTNNEPIVFLVSYTQILDVLTEMLRQPKPYKIAIGVIGICGGTVYLDKPAEYYENNVYVVGSRTVEDVLYRMATKSWFVRNFLIKT